MLYVVDKIFIFVVNCRSMRGFDMQEHIMLVKRDDKVWFDLLREHGSDILLSENFKIIKGHIQHGTMPVRSHAINVARMSVIIALRFHIRCNMRSLIRGALLHDYFLYDWHDNEHRQIFRLHGFFHPGIALKNASLEYDLNGIERDIIKKHMWPLTVVLPLYKESWIVVIADKYCSLLETLRIYNSYSAKRKPGY